MQRETGREMGQAIIRGGILSEINWESA